MGVWPMSVETESRYISSLIRNLNNNICLNVDPLPDLARGTKLHVVLTSLSMIGGSHTARVAGTLSDNMPSFMWSGGVLDE